jgi:hypothetical protein
MGAAACDGKSPATADWAPAAISFEEPFSSDPSVFDPLTNPAGFAENFAAQPFEQKYHVFPPCSTFAAARAGSTLIPQTGSTAPAGGGERTGSDMPV